MTTNRIQAALEELLLEQESLAQEVKECEARVRVAKNQLALVQKAIAALDGNPSTKPKANTLSAEEIGAAIDEELKRSPGGVSLESLKAAIKTTAKELGRSARGLHRVLPRVLAERGLVETDGVIR